MNIKVKQKYPSKLQTKVFLVLGAAVAIVFDSRKLHENYKKKISKRKVRFFHLLFY